MFRLYRQDGSDLDLGFLVETQGPLSEVDKQKLHWLVAETFEPALTGTEPHFALEEVVPIGPRLAIETPFSSNAVSICRGMGISNVTRIECLRHHRINEQQSAEQILKNRLDRMTESHYPDGITSFDTGIVPEDVQVVDLLGGGRSVLEEMSRENSLGMDAADIDYYMDLFGNREKRNPTNVEVFQLGNANSEHSRHGYWRGRQVIDGVTMPRTLMEIVQEPWKRLPSGNRSLVAFHDNAGVIRGFEVDGMLPFAPGKPSMMRLLRYFSHITGTAETHNHPSYYSSYHGGGTGGGGRIRDVAAVGRGGIVCFGIAGYFVGSLFITGYSIPGEVFGRNRVSKYSSPLMILLQGSDGIADYGNRFGEPTICGFTRAFEQIVDGEWRASRKPTLYTAGVGHVFDEHVKKEPPEVGMLIVRIGGPAYPIGVGGGGASSATQGENNEEADLKSVQRGNPEMENRANRATRAAVEMREENPISSEHDQGAGGPSNLLTELVEKLGGIVRLRDIILGDQTMSVLQIWVAEFQEGYGLLIRKDKIGCWQKICDRERVNCEILGEVTGSGRIVLYDSQTDTTPVNLDLKQILTNVPQKTFTSTRKIRVLPPLDLPAATLGEDIEAVFKQLNVGSKGHLVHKKDRSVGGLVTQQQCCGIAQIPIANVAMAAQTHFGLTGSAAAVGEQPIKMLINSKAGARMAVGEMLIKMGSAKITSLHDISLRANWMWPAKMPHEGPLLYDAAVAMADLLISLGYAADGGKDSLTMAVTIAGEVAKSPGNLVIKGYVPVPDITKKMTPDIKKPGSTLVLVDLGRGQNRLGGSSLAQAYNQLGNQTPDVDDPTLLKNTFLAMQEMIDSGRVLAAHHRSDGGVITTVAEMCMASRCGFALNVFENEAVRDFLFNEELGVVLEVETPGKIRPICRKFGIPYRVIGVTRSDEVCCVSKDAKIIWQSPITNVRQMWEATSHQLERLKRTPVCADAEYAGHTVNLPSADERPNYVLQFTPKATPPDFLDLPDNPKVAVIREEGTNGDRELMAACLAAGLAPWDITMSDLLAGRITLKDFRGILFPGGFSYMDVFGSAKGWAGIILFNDVLKEMFEDFYSQPNTWSLGVCNGCQLMSLLGWVPLKGTKSHQQPRFVHNVSRKFESRWTQVEILPSPSILLKGMEGSKLGVWCAHGEGRLVYPDAGVAGDVASFRLAPMVFIDPYGNPTEEYPYNPNGSPGGVTALCSKDGRHLAMMPHPERCFKLWQWPWLPSSWQRLEASPWLRMFQNARTWCLEHP